MSKKISENHARARLIQRTGGEIAFRELRYRVRDRKDLVFLERQSCTRSLCATHAEGRWIYFVVNKERNSIITVLTEKQVCISLSLTLEELHARLQKSVDNNKKVVDKADSTI